MDNYTVKTIDGRAKILSKVTGLIHIIASNSDENKILSNAHSQHIIRTNDLFTGWNKLLEQGIDIDCIELKENLAYYKEPIDYNNLDAELFRSFIRTNHLTAKWEQFLIDNKK